MAESGNASGATFSCLIVEDDSAFAGMLRTVVLEEGGRAEHAPCLAAARERLARGRYDLVLLDNHLPDGKGFDFYTEIQQGHPGQTVIVLTGLPELSQAVELTRRGLFDYLSKPVDCEALAGSLKRAKQRWQRSGWGAPGDERMVATSRGTREVVLALEQASRHPTATVLLTGETGTGKDAAARMLHSLTFQSRRAATPLVALNCAAVPAEMFEAELFGAERGAYTGADRARVGLAASASPGTLFLDEIGEVPLAMQAKLLRFLEAREYRPLGSNTVRRFEGRLVAATNRDLRAEVAAGRFREDLLYRLDVFTVHLPPLRERSDEVPALAEYLLKQLCAKYERQDLRIRDEDLVELQRYRFPGNVRELRNLLERSLLRTAPEQGWLSLDRAWLGRVPVVVPQSTEVAPARGAAVPNGTPNAGSAEEAGTGASGRVLPPLEAKEYEMVRQALVDANGGIRRAAALLGITHQALLRRLEKWPELRQSPPKP